MGCYTITGKLDLETYKKISSSPGTAVFSENRGVIPGVAYEALFRKVRELEKAEQVQRALFAISDLAGAPFDMGEILKRLHEIISRLMVADNFFIALYDDAMDSIRFLYFVDVATAPPDMAVSFPLKNLEYSLTWYVLKLGRSLRGSLEEIASQIPGEFKPRGVDAKDWLGVPMIENYRVHGVLAVQSYGQSGLYGPEDQELLEFVASHVLITLQRREASEALERAVRIRTEELARTNERLRREIVHRERNEKIQRALYHIAEQAGDSGREKLFYRTIHLELGRLLYADNFYIALLTDENRSLEFAYYVNEYDPPSPKRVLRNGLTEYVLQVETDVLLDKSQIQRLIEKGAISVRGRLPYAWLGVPLRCEGNTLGVMVVQSYRSDCIYQQPDAELMRFVSNQIASSLERKRALASLRESKSTLEQRVLERTWALEKEIAVRKAVEEQLKHEVLHDHLTGLPNRAYLMERLDHLFLRDIHGDDTRRLHAIMFLDIDAFKSINDAYGHHLGDMILREVSRRLAESVRSPDIAARLAGDEFAVLLQDIGQKEDALKVVRRFQGFLRKPIVVAGQSMDVTTSIGIAYFDETTTSASELLSFADNAMYQAKSSGRNRYRIYTGSRG